MRALSEASIQDVPLLYAELLNPAHYSFDEKSLWNFSAAILAGIVGALIVRWERGTRVSQLFAIFCFLFMLWAAGRGLLRVLIDPDMIVFVARRNYVFIMLALVVLYHFASIMLRTEKQRMTLIRLNWGISISFALASFTSTSMIAGVERFSWGYEPVYGSLGYASMLWMISLMAMVAVDAYRAWRDSPADRIEHRRITLFVVALLILYGTFVDFLAVMGIAVYPLGFVPVVLFTLITAYITYRYGLVDVTPELVANHLADMMRGALLILDQEGIVQFANSRCQAVLGHGSGALVGKPARQVLGDAFDREGLATLARAEDRDQEKEWTYLNPSTGQTQELAMSVVAVKDNHRREVAQVCVLRDITEHKRANQDRQSASLHDSLTELPNRAMFIGLLDAVVHRSRESPDYSYAVCFLGLDRLRVINEDLGHAAGDKVLAEVSLRLRKAVRSQDTVARVGGDEFGVLLRGHSGLDEVKGLAGRLLESLRVPLNMGDHELFLSASAGVITGAQRYVNGADLLRRASMAMYRAKDDGGNTVQFAAAGDTASQRTRLESDLRHALEHDEFQVHYQPIIDLVERRVTGFEALVRWQHPQRGLLLPAEFIEFAEKAGLIGLMDRIVLRQACADARKFQQALGDPRLSVSVNLSEDEMLNPILVEQIQEYLAETGLDPAALRIELLERVALIEPLRVSLNRLRVMGVGLYVDDFGTGYSALSRLHELPVTAVKIDRDFVRSMSLGDGGEKVISSILALTRSLRLDVIAEGCASASEVRRLYEMGCRMVQGFYFSKGVPFEAALQVASQPELLQARFDELALQPPSLVLPLRASAGMP